MSDTPRPLRPGELAEWILLDGVSLDAHDTANADPDPKSQDTGNLCEHWSTQSLQGADRLVGEYGLSSKDTFTDVRMYASDFRPKSGPQHVWCVKMSRIQRVYIETCLPGLCSCFRTFLGYDWRRPFFFTLPDSIYCSLLRHCHPSDPREFL